MVVAGMQCGAPVAQASPCVLLTEPSRTPPWSPSFPLDRKSQVLLFSNTAETGRCQIFN